MADELRQPSGVDEFKAAALAAGFDGTRPQQLGHLDRSEQRRAALTARRRSLRRRAITNGSQIISWNANLWPELEIELKDPWNPPHGIYRCKSPYGVGTVLQFSSMVLTLRKDRRAVTALEYGLIAGVIVATIMVGFTLLANDLSKEFQSIGNTLTNNL
jgi:pilus assembly protein Flp/PilA